MKELIRTRPVLAHFVLSTLIACLVVLVALVRAIVDPMSTGAIARVVEDVFAGPGYVNLATLTAGAFQEPDILLVFIFAGAPTIAAILLCAAVSRDSVARLLARLKPIGPQGTLQRSLVAYAGLLAIYGAGFLVYDWVAGPGVNVYDRLAGFGLPILLGALLALFLDEGGTLEELGWRGFAWPALMESLRSPIGAALILGVLHWAWHLPREVFTLMGGVSLDVFALNQAIFLMLTICLSVVAGYCVNLTGGSVLPAIMVHGGTNVWSKALGEFVSPTFGLLDLRTLIVMVLAIGIVILAGKNLGLQKARGETGG